MPCPLVNHLINPNHRRTLRTRRAYPNRTVIASALRVIR